MDLWRNFKIAAFTEVIRQKDDADFIYLLNKFRVGNIYNNAENVLKTHFISKKNPSYLTEALYIFPENRPARVHNQTILDNHSGPLISIHVENEIPKDCSNVDIAKARNRSQWETGGLALPLHLKIDARVVITATIDIWATWYSNTV